MTLFLAKAPRWFAALSMLWVLGAPAVARAEGEGDSQDEELAAEPGEVDGSEWKAQAPPPLPPGPQSSPEESEPSASAPSAAPTQQDFESALSPYGQWISVPGLGQVWRPSAESVGEDFVPYTTGGTWVSSPQGWAFESAWEWGWAPFHYGRWYHQPEWGWVWTPGFAWAPAWVDWRCSGGYVAWAPLPPAGLTLSFMLGVPGWSFLAYRHFGHPWMARHLFYPRAHVGYGGGWGWARRPEWRGSGGGYRGPDGWAGTRQGPGSHSVSAPRPYGGGSPHPSSPMGGGLHGGGGFRGGGGFHSGGGGFHGSSGVQGGGGGGFHRSSGGAGARGGAHGASGHRGGR